MSFLKPNETIINDDFTDDLVKYLERLAHQKDEQIVLTTLNAILFMAKIEIELMKYEIDSYSYSFNFGLSFYKNELCIGTFGKFLGIESNGIGNESSVLFQRGGTKYKLFYTTFQRFYKESLEQVVREYEDFISEI